jgi:tetratricopeptide (TPR) repeat protein
MSGWLRVIVLSGAMTFAGGHVVAAGIADDSDPGTEPAIVVHGDREALAIRFYQQDPADVAEALAAATGIRIDGAEDLRGQTAITADFREISAHVVVLLLADQPGRLVRRAGPDVYAIGAAGEREALLALMQALENAEAAGDADRVDAAEQALLVFIRPAAEGPVTLDAEPWFTAARRAEQREDLEAAEALLREAARHLQRRDGAIGLEYGRSLARIGRIRGLRGDEDDARVLTEQGLALAEAELGQVDPRLARMQAQLASRYRSAGRIDEAADLLHRAIASHGEPAPESIEAFALAETLTALASLYQQQERWAESVPLLERSIALARASLGDDVAWLEASLLSTSLILLDRLPEAEGWLQYVLQEGRGGLRNDHALLQVIQWLGPFAAAAAHDAESGALLGTPFPSVSVEATMMIGGVLQDRAIRQRRESSRSPAWQRTCAVYAVVVTAALADAVRSIEELRRFEEQSCHRHASKG